MPKQREVVGYVYVFQFRRPDWEDDVCNDCTSKADKEGRQGEEITLDAAGARQCRYCGSYLDENYED